MRLSRSRECSAHRRPERSREGQARELFASLGPTYDRVGGTLWQSSVRWRPPPNGRREHRRTPFGGRQ
jgi:hypothetical protein